MNRNNGKDSARTSKKWREWREQRTETLELPSGLTVRVRKILLRDLVLYGKIPAPLFESTEKFTREKQGNQDLTVKELQEHPEFLQFIDHIVRATVIDPPLADQSDEEHLSIDELTFDDRMMIFNWNNGGAAELAPFPGESRTDERAGGDGGEVSLPSE